MNSPLIPVVPGIPLEPVSEMECSSCRKTYFFVITIVSVCLTGAIVFGYVIFPIKITEVH